MPTIKRPKFELEEETSVTGVRVSQELSMPDQQAIDQEMNSSIGSPSVIQRNNLQPKLEEMKLYEAKKEVNKPKSR
jgi:hypothetical protein